MSVENLAKSYRVTGATIGDSKTGSSIVGCISEKSLKGSQGYIDGSFSSAGSIIAISD